MKWAISIVVFVCMSQAAAQIRRDSQDRLFPTLLDKESRVTAAQVQKAKQLFQTIEDAIVEGKVSSFSIRFDRQIFVNISKGESGYFSADQATSILQHYLATRKVISFKFTRLSEKGLSPYATGRLVSIYRGSQESAQVYVSCFWQDSAWVIGQFNIY